MSVIDNENTVCCLRKVVMCRALEGCQGRAVSGDVASRDNSLTCGVDLVGVSEASKRRVESLTESVGEGGVDAPDGDIA